MSNEKELKIVKKDETKKTTKLDEAAIKKVEEELASLTEKLKGKLYLITKDSGIVRGLLDFMETKAKWTGLESAGVSELVSMIKKSKEKLSLDATATQALFWFMKEHKGTGFSEAESFVTLLKPVSEAMQRMQSDKKEHETLQYRLASLEGGVDPDQAKNILKGVK